MSSSRSSGISESLLLSSLMIVLYSTVSSLKSIFGMVVITSPSFSSHCPCWTSASVLGCYGTGWLQLSVLCFSLYFALSRSVLWFALPAVGFAPLSSFHHHSRSSCSSRCLRTLVALLRCCRRWLVDCGSVSDSHHLLLACGSFCASFPEAFHWSFLASPNITTQH